MDNYINYFTYSLSWGESTQKGSFEYPLSHSGKVNGRIREPSVCLLSYFKYGVVGLPIVLPCLLSSVVYYFPRAECYEGENHR